MADVLPKAAASASSGVDPSLQNLSAFLNLISGSSSTTSGGTKTTSNNVSAEGITELMNQMMQGTGGLADVATGAHAAGMYGDTTKTLLTQNLLTKIAGTAALQNAVTTTTTSPTTDKKNPELTWQSGLQSLAMAGLAKAGSIYSKKLGLTDALGLGDSTAATAAPVAIATPAAIQSQVGFDSAGNNINTLASAGSSSDFASIDPASFSGDSASVGDNISAFSGDTGSVASSAGADVSSESAAGGDFFDSFFSRGGRVGAPRMKVKGYATGGLVNSEIPVPIERAAGPSVSDIVLGAANSISSSALPSGITRSVGSPTNSGGGTPGAGSPNPNNPDRNLSDLSLSDIATAGLLGIGIVSNPVLGVANAVSTMSTGKGLIGNALSIAGGAFGLGSDSAPGGGMSGNQSAGGGNSGAAMSTDTGGVADASGISVDSGYGGESGMGAMGVDTNSGDAGGTETAGGESGEAEGGGMGGGDSGGSYAAGGQISAPGDGQTDTKFIKAADDEFVLNANAAKAIGYDKLNWLNTVLGGSPK